MDTIKSLEKEVAMYKSRFEELDITHKQLVMTHEKGEILHKQRIQTLEKEKHNMSILISVYENSKTYFIAHLMVLTPVRKILKSIKRNDETEWRFN